MVYSKFCGKTSFESPFVKKEFLNLVKQFNDDQVTVFEDFAVSDKTIVNIGNRDFVDYRPTIEISKKFLRIILFQILILTRYIISKFKNYYNRKFINQSR